MQQARIRFNSHKQTAKSRGIDFKFDFESWYTWWLNHGVDKNFPTASTAIRPCMCRYGDQGPYELSNVYLGTIGTNMRDYFKFTDRSRGNNSNAKRIKTPIGVFDTCSEAAQAYNKSRKWIYNRLGKDFSYTDKKD